MRTGEGIGWKVVGQALRLLQWIGGIKFEVAGGAPALQALSRGKGIRSRSREGVLGVPDFLDRLLRLENLLIGIVLPMSVRG